MDLLMLGIVIVLHFELTHVELVEVRALLEASHGVLGEEVELLYFACLLVPQLEFFDVILDECSSDFERFYKEVK